MTLKNQIAEAQRDRKDLYQKFYSDPELLAAQSALKATTDRVWKRYYKEIEEKRALIRALESQLVEEERRKASVLPLQVAEFLRRVKKGVDWGVSEFRIRWISEDACFFIFTRASHLYWNGIGAPRAFAPTRHTLVDLRRMPPEPKMESGLKLYHACEIREHEGRLTRLMLEDMIASANRAKKEK